LDEPLAQFDRLLRDIQVALAPEREPAPPAQARPLEETRAQRSEPESAPSRGRPGPLAEILERARRERPEPEPEPEPESEPAPGKPDCCHRDLSGELSELAELRASLEELRASLGELLQGYRGALLQALAASAPPLAAPARANEFTLVAGPFVALEAVRTFERMLLALPGIEQVAIRGYEGADRAIVDVRITPPNS
jgi:hypothetical protein